MCLYSLSHERGNSENSIYKIPRGGLSVISPIGGRTECSQTSLQRTPFRTNTRIQRTNFRLPISGNGIHIEKCPGETNTNIANTRIERTYFQEPHYRFSIELIPFTTDTIFRPTFSFSSSFSRLNPSMASLFVLRGEE